MERTHTLALAFISAHSVSISMSSKLGWFLTLSHNSGQVMLSLAVLLLLVVSGGCVSTGESVTKSVRPVVSTRLNAPGDMDENIVSKMSKFSFSFVESEVSRQVLKRGSFLSNRLSIEVGEKVGSGTVEVDDGMVGVNPFERFWGDWFCVNVANVWAKESRMGDVSELVCRNNDAEALLPGELPNKSVENRGVV